ncbi:M48 family metalloprotease [Rufibacter roseolus]|uniref:hypothetical protein n=1 Tax=Rufibacter roseolus TaxID=2817375 RepID=UPI001B313165|nr:hypothetical protein [Rufibacter roseolus]
MKFPYFLLCLGFLLFLSLESAFAQHWMPPVPLIPNPKLKDLAMANYSDSLKSYVIEYNPELAIEVGPFVTAYFQAHEYGHIYRNHVNKKKLRHQDHLNMLQLNQDMETGADLYAVETLYEQDKSIVLAMLHYLKNTEKEDLQHLSRKDRINALEQHFYYLSSFVRENVDCTHSAHGQDQIPCSHYNAAGKPQHSHDYVPCLHIAHLEGHIIVKKVTE